MVWYYGFQDLHGLEINAHSGIIDRSLLWRVFSGDAHVKQMYGELGNKLVT